MADYGYERLRTTTKPAFIIHGESDGLAPIRHVRRLYSEMAEPKELVVIEGADHVFDGKTSIVGETIADLLGDYAGHGEHGGHEGHEDHGEKEDQTILRTAEND